MASFFKRLRKRAKRIGRKIRKGGKRLIRKTAPVRARVIEVALPVAGAVVAGPLGAAAGTAIAAPIVQIEGTRAARGRGRRGRDARRTGRRFRREALIVGGAITGITGVAAIAGGTGLTESSVTSIDNIFGGGSAVGIQPTTGGMEGDITKDLVFSEKMAGPAGTQITFDPAADLAGQAAVGAAEDAANVGTSTWWEKVLGIGATVTGEVFGSGSDVSTPPWNPIDPENSGSIGFEGVQGLGGVQEAPGVEEAGGINFQNLLVIGGLALGAVLLLRRRR